MSRRDVVVIGASAGGVEALRGLVSGLPIDFPAAILVVLHVPPTGSSALPQILDRAGPLPAKQAEEGDRIEPGRILIAPPDRHMIVYNGSVTMSHGPRENGHRPAVDVLFRTAARVLGRRVIAVVLSGALDDGAAGMVAVKLCGGLGLVQDPDDALHASMPRAALAAAGVQHVVPVAKMPALLSRFVAETVDNQAGEPSELMELEADMADLDQGALHNPERPGEPAGLSCPDCNGSLFEIAESGLTRFRCRVGHAWSPDSLVAQQSASLESALWMALRSLEEKVALTRDLATRATEQGHRVTASTFGHQADDAHHAAELVRRLIQEISRVTDLSNLSGLTADFRSDQEK